MYTPKTWLTTDTHFNHKKLEDYGSRPVGFTELIVDNWRRMVRKEDTIIHLGDVILGKNGTLGEILSSLPGRKILVRGNHDHESGAWYERHGFHYVAQGILMGGVWLSHYPAQTLPSGAIVNVHGHFHDMYKGGLPSDYPEHCKLLALENTNYEPVELDNFVGFNPIMRKFLL